MKNKIFVLTLGCSKNLVDSENLIGLLEKNNLEFTDNIHEADTMLINTCGFIKDAKEESINVILEAAELKQIGKLKRVGVFGCLPERYKPELETQIKGIDFFFGVNSFSDILSSLSPDLKYELQGERHLLTPKHFAYLKIAEGCNHSCAFCAIPKIRGKYISVPQEKLLEETRFLASKGVKELNIIAQDTTYYGKDLYGKQIIAELLTELEKIQGIEWIRLMYTYPVAFPENLLDVMANSEKICKYIDIPFQHISDKILKKMGRGITGDSIKKLIDKIRNKVPDVAIRSTFIVGFPGESPWDFIELYDFIKEYELDRVGAFEYSHEENTEAYKFRYNVPWDMRKGRYCELMELQKKIALKKNREKIGKTLKVLIDDFYEGKYIGRTEHDAPDVDNTVIISSKKKIQVGSFAKVRISNAKEYDLVGRII